jgi:hypothetical protein
MLRFFFDGCSKVLTRLVAPIFTVFHQGHSIGKNELRCTNVSECPIETLSTPVIVIQL